MKKLFLLLVPALMLVGCNKTSESSSEAKPSSSSSEEQTTRVYADVRLTFTVSGITTYEDDHTKIYMNSDAFQDASSTNWTTYPLTQDEEDPNKWEIIVQHFELEQAMSFNLVYGNDDGPNWASGKNLIEGAYPDDTQYRTLVTEREEINYNLTAEFKVGTDKLDVDVVINPTIKPTSDTEEAMLETTYVWAWNSVNNNTVKFEKQGDGTWKYTFKITLVDGSGSIQVTPVLGTSEAADWTYQHGGYEGTTWSTWGGWNIPGYNSETTSQTINITFKAQPSAA